jgi:hypothetical protein
MVVMTERRLVLVVLVMVACGGQASAPAPVTAATPPTPATSATPAYAPQLFTLEQLRAGNPEGRTIELRMELDGAPATIEHWEFTAVDAETATIHAITRDEAGAVIADQTGTSTWQELHRHAQFPAAETTIEDGVSVTVPAGSFRTRLYTVTSGETVRRFWFAEELPGPPVQFTTEKAGRVVMRAQMLRAK